MAMCEAARCVGKNRQGDTMKHTSESRYPAPSEVVIKMFSDTDYHKKKMEALGIEYEILTDESDGDEYHLKAQRMVPINATGMVAKIMPATSTVVNDERWRLSDKTGSVSVETKGVPLDMSCTANIRDEGDGCVITYDWTIKARIPIGGGALEKFVVNDMQKREAEELQAAHALIDQYR